MRRALRKAFTLLELMVAVAIASVTVAALYSIFTTQSRQLITQDLHMEMHQNLRFATDMLSRSIRIAGFGSAGTIYGTLGASYPTAGSSDDALPVVMSWNQDSDNEADAITVVYGDPSLVMDTRNDVLETCDTTALYFRPNQLDYQEKMAQYEAGELVVCFDYADMSGMKAFLWSLSADPDTTNGELYVNTNSPYADFATKCPSGENLTPIMTCSKAHVLTFYLDDSEADGVGPGNADHPVLMMDMDLSWPDDDDVPLVDNIEDMQFEYCLDDGTNTVDCSVAGAWTDEFDTHDVNLLWMVRVALSARSSREEFTGSYRSIRAGLADHSAMDSADATGHFRQVLVSEITVRNIRYQANL